MNRSTHLFASKLRHSLFPHRHFYIMATSETPSSPSQQASAAKKPKVLIITGPTAVGKTNISLTLAERLGGEIISADSVQVYKGLDIGSDKIPVADRRGIPHHLLDVLDPKEEFSAAVFYTLARQATEDILSRGKVPIVVGGTGMYLKWYMHGKPATGASTKESEAAATAKLDAAWAAAAGAAGRDLTPEEKWDAGVKVIEDLGDLETAARVRKETNNYYRLHRMVDVLMQSGGRTLAEMNLDVEKPWDYDFRPFFLHRPRVELYRRIDGRVEEMVYSGLMQEVNGLLEQGLQPNTNCATKAIGYRQAMEFLQQCKTTHTVDEASIIQVVRDIQAASRQFCHRQFNWFRDNPSFQWISADRDQEAVLSDILESWNSEVHEGNNNKEEDGRLTPEEQKEMRRYVSKLMRFVQGSESVGELLNQVQELLRIKK